VISYRLSHVLLRFADLNQAVSAYRELGFEVRLSLHWQGAWIFLPDGVLLEFLPQGASALERSAGVDELLHGRARHYTGRYGLLDYCLTPSAPLEATRGWLEAQGLSLAPLHTPASPLVPLMLAPWHPLPLLYNPALPHPRLRPAPHPNAVCGLHSLTVQTANLLGDLIRYRRLLGQEGRCEAGEWGRRAVFTLGPHLLYLQSSTQEGLASLTLRTLHPVNGPLNRTQTQGVVLHLLGDPALEAVPADPEKGETL
jgi:hypothetical protein